MADLPLRTKIGKLAERLAAARSLPEAHALADDLRRLARVPERAPRPAAKPRTDIAAILAVDPQRGRTQVAKAYQDGKTTTGAAVLLGCSKRTLERLLAADHALAHAVDEARKRHG